MLSQRADEGKAFTVKPEIATPIGATSTTTSDLAVICKSSSELAREGEGSIPTRSRAAARPRELSEIHSLVSLISVQIDMLRLLEDERAELTERFIAVSSDVVDSLGRRENRGGRRLVLAVLSLVNTDSMVCYLTRYIMWLLRRPTAT